jgi:hypothetical protein
LVWLARFAFQACSFNHSDISPLLESTTCERSAIRISQNGSRILLWRDEIWIQRFTDDGNDNIAEIVSDVLMSRDHLRRSRPRLALVWSNGRQWPCTPVAIPQRVLPAVDHPVVAAKWALPHDVSRGAFELRDDVAATATPSWTASTGHIGVLVAIGQVIRDPGHDGAEEDRQTENAFRNHLRQVPGALINVVPQSTTQPVGLTMSSIRDPATALASVAA